MVKYFLFFVILFSFLSCEKDIIENEYEVNIDRNKILMLVNDARTNGYTCEGFYYEPVDTLIWNKDIEEAAYIHCVHVYENGIVDEKPHFWKDGTGPVDRLKMVGYNGTFGENFAWGQDTEEHVINDWLNSPGHCRNIMNPNFRIMGVSKVGIYWTQVFGR